ncbi:Alpha/Beta hydrolase protein, partial [Entophlyctis helioformis]
MVSAYMIEMPQLSTGPSDRQPPIASIVWAQVAHIGQPASHPRYHTPHIPNTMLPIRIIVAVAAIAGSALAAPPPTEMITVDAAAGMITGGRSATEGFSFVGIPYAQAARWSQPIPLATFSTPFSALTPRPACPQICRQVSMFCPQDMDEDCLSLNVWTPFSTPGQLRAANAIGAIAAPRSDAALLPVLVLIHGGSFEQGSADMPALRAAELANATQSIVVTLNYRLGIFGFPGSSLLANSGVNLGILDQRLAIEWIRFNIRSFGGDASRMTLAGQSAGAMSALVHMADPTTKSRFRSLILMSPPAVALRSPARATADTTELSGRVGCATSSTDPAALAACMRSKTTRELLDAIEAIAKDKSHTPSLDTSLPAVIDGTVIPQHPIQILENANIMAGLKVMLGATANETSYFLRSMSTVGLPQPIYTVAVDAVFPGRGEDVRRAYADTGLDHGPLGDDFGPRLARIESDHLFVCAPQRSVRRLQASPSPPNATRVFSYFWETPWTSTFDDPVGRLCDSDACHTTDLALFLRSPSDAHGARVSAAFRQYAANLMYNGDPNIPAPFAATVPVPSWPPFDAADGGRATAFPVARFPTVVSSASSAPAVVIEPSHPLKSRCDLMDTIPYEYEPPVTVSLPDSAIISLPIMITFWLILILICIVQVAILVFAKWYSQRLEFLLLQEKPLKTTK